MRYDQGSEDFMSDVITGLRHSAKLESVQRRSDLLQKSMDTQHDSVMKTLDAFRAEMRSDFASLRANNQIEVLRRWLPSANGSQWLSRG